MENIIQNTYELVELIEADLITDEEIDHLVENGLVDAEMATEILTSLSEGVWDASRAKEIADKAADTKAKLAQALAHKNDAHETMKAHMDIIKELPYKDRVSYMKNNVNPDRKIANEADKNYEIAEKNHTDASNELTIHKGMHPEAHSKLNSVKEKAAEVKKEVAAAKSQDAVETKAQAKDLFNKNELDGAGLKPSEGYKLDHSNHLNKGLETKSQGALETKGAAANGSEHGSGIIDHIHDHATEYGATAAGLAAAGAGAYALHKYLKNRKAMKGAHDLAHASAMNNLSKSHPELAEKAKKHISNDIHEVIKGNKSAFKQNKESATSQLAKHFGSDEYKKRLVAKLKG